MRMKLIGLVVAGASLCATAVLSQTSPSGVRLEKTGNRYQLLQNGKPYFIKGAGGRERLEELVACGGNSIRTWGADEIGPLLDQARKLGLTVTIGIWLGHPEHGFNYADGKAVAEQLERARRVVRQYKDHPALLLWALGNEMEGDGTNPRIWQAINDLARMVKEEDPQHPTMTVVAELGAAKIRAFNEFAPAVDILGINTYGGIQSVRKRYVADGGTRPYVVTEFGPPGHWEMGKTPFGVPTEMNSTAKAAWYGAGYRDGIATQRDLCLGSYVFVWGSKQEATATWYGMFLRDGARLGAVESMTRAWGGAPATNHCPEVTNVVLSRDTGLKAGELIHASWTVSDPDHDSLTVKWILRRESGQYQTGGGSQSDEPDYPECLVKSATQEAEIRVPESGGNYRLFAYAYDGHGNAAVANAPLHVEGPVLPPKPVVAKVPFPVYGDGPEAGAYIPSGYMGDAAQIAMDLASSRQPFSGSSCIEAQFKSDKGWGGVVWQSPPNDWGDQAGGYDLSAANVLSFRVRGAEGGERVTFGMGLIGADKPFPDSDSVAIKELSLTTEWREIRLPLGGRNLSCIKSGFYWTLGGQGRPVTFYLDQIEYVHDATLPEAVSKPVAGHATTPAKVRKPAPLHLAMPVALYEEEGDAAPYVPSGYMGNTAAIKMDLKCAEAPHTGTTCLKVSYIAGGEWGGVVWQSPANDWGDQPGGYNLNGATSLSFWARGATGGEKVTFGVGMIGSDKPYCDSAKACLKEVELGRVWQEFRIPLKGQDLSCIKSGFFWTLGAQGKPVEFYLDDIRYVGDE